MDSHLSSAELFPRAKSASSLEVSMPSTSFVLGRMANSEEENSGGSMFAAFSLDDSLMRAGSAFNSMTVLRMLCEDSANEGVSVAIQI